MKELSIEEKARRYDESLIKARNIVSSINVGLIGKDSFEAVFPELKESGNERIRKEIINFFEHYPNIIVKKERRSDWIAWLENQAQKPVFEMITPEESLGIDSDTYNKIVDECIYGEQKPTNKVDPKFHKGYDSIKAGIQAHAETYSFNIESELFNQLTKEQQALWKKEIEQAVVSGGEVGYELAKDSRYKENVEVKGMDLEEEIDNIWNPRFNLGWDEKSLLSMNHEGFTTVAKHFFELGLKAQKGKEV